MNTLNKILTLLLIITLVSCDRMLEPQLDGSLSEEGIWTNNLRAFGFLNNAYHNLPNGYNRISSAMLDAATDDAICPDPLSAIHGFYDGNWSPHNVIDNVWNKNFEGVRKVNTFLQKIDSVPIFHSSVSLGSGESVLRTRERMKGEAYFLRAYFNFELVKRYGAIPLVDKVLTAKEAESISASSIEECFQFILNDCDSAVSRLPRVYGVDPIINGYNEAKEIGRATSGAAKALKSRVLLYQASPLFNEENDIQKWINAAEEAKEVLNYTISEDNNSKLYALNRFTSTVNMTDLFSTNAVLPLYHKEIIFSTHYNSNTTIEQLNAPISYGARGLTNPTQNLVDAFPMRNGKTINDPTSGYNPDNPFNNRDPRLAMTVLYNGADFSINDKSGKIETFVGGKDGPDAYPNASKTGYYLKKFVMPLAVWDGRTVNVTRTWILIRLAEIYLNFAEAHNEAYGPDAEVYDAIKQLRRRAGLSPSDVEAGLNQDQMRELIRNERRIELAFEEHRFFDVRRWKLYDDQQEAEKLLTIRGAKITKDENDNIIMDMNQIVQKRIFTPKMYFYPIAESELLKNKQLNQNDGW